MSCCCLLQSHEQGAIAGHLSLSMKIAVQPVIHNGRAQVVTMMSAGIVQTLIPDG